MGYQKRKKKKVMEAVARCEAIKRQQAVKDKPFRYVLYQGKKAIMVAQKGGERGESEGVIESSKTNATRIEPVEAAGTSDALTESGSL